MHCIDAGRIDERAVRSEARSDERVIGRPGQGEFRVVGSGAVAHRRGRAEYLLREWVRERLVF